MTTINGSGTRVNGEPFQVVERVGRDGPIPADSLEVLGNDGDGANFLFADLDIGPIGAAKWYRFHNQNDLVTLQRATNVQGVGGEPNGWIDVAVLGSGLVSPARASFIANLLGILGTTPMLYLPTGGTTETDASRNGKTITYSGTTSLFDAPPTALGNGLAVHYNGADEQADTPDTPDLGFGNGVADSAMTVFALVSSDVGGALETLLAKWDETNAALLRCWSLHLDASDRPTFERFDESANASIGRRATAITIGSWTLIIATSDASETSAGINIYVDGTDDDNADVETGAYTAEEDLATIVTLAHQIGDAGLDEFFNGSIALAGVVAREVSADEAWQMKELVNAYFNLTLG